MKNYKKTIALCVIVICTTLQSSEQSKYNIFCCSNVTNQIIYTTNNVTQVKLTKQIQVKERSESKAVEFKASHVDDIKKSQANANIKALRLLAVINNEDLMENKKYDALERITQNQAHDLQIKSNPFNLYFNAYHLLTNYSVYSNSNQNLSPFIKKRYLEEKNKKQVAANIQALRLQAVIENPKLMDNNKFSNLEKIMQNKAADNKVALNEQCHSSALNVNYSIYSDKNVKINNRLTRSKNIK